MARLRLAAFGVLLALLAAPPCLADETDRAEELFRDGNQAFALGDYQTAFTHYREAWSLKKSFDIACNLGRTEAELGLHRDAAEHLDTCLRTFSVSSRGGLKDAKGRFRDLFNRVRAEVGALDVRVRPSGAEITVDGIDFGSAPLDRQLFVDPGRRRVKARLRGYREKELAVEVSAGGTLSVVLELSPAPSVPLAVASPPPPPPPASRVEVPPPEARGAAPHPSRGLEPRTIVVLSGAGLTLVGLGVGVGFMVDANSASETAAELGAALAGVARPCGPDDASSDCRALREAMEREDRSREVASAVFLGSAIVSAATLGLWLILPDLEPSSSTGLHVAPRIARSSGVLTLSGSY